MSDSQEHRGWIGRLLGGRRTQAARPVPEDRRAWARPGELVDLDSLPPDVARAMVDAATAIDEADQAYYRGDLAQAEQLLRGAVTTEIDPYRQLAEERLGGMLSQDGRMAEAVALWLRAARGPDPGLRQAVATCLGSIPLADGAFLVNADPATMRAVLPEAWGFGRPGAAVYQASAHRHRDAGPAVRRRLLVLDALRYGDRELAARFEAVPLDERFPQWHPVWASGSQLGGCLWSVAGHPKGTSAVTTATVDGRPVVVTGGEEGTVRLWDLATGEPVGEPMTGHTQLIRSVATAEPDGRPVAVSGGVDRTVRVWDLRTRRLLHPPLTGHTGWVTAVDTAVVRGRTVAVTCGEDRTVRVWDLATGEPVGTPMHEPPLTAHHYRSRLSALATTVLGRRPVAVTGDMGGTLRVWELAKGRQLGPALETGGGSVSSLAAVLVDGRPTVAVGHFGGVTTLWDVATGRRAGERMAGPKDASHKATAVETGGGVAVAVSDHAGLVRLLDPATGRQLAQAFAGPRGGTRALATTVLDGRPVVLVGTDDGRVHRWDPDLDVRPVGDPLPGHGGPVTAVVTVGADGAALVVSTAADGTARLWDPDTGAAAGTPSTGHRGWVQAMAAAVVDGRPVLVTTEGDTAVRLWDPATGAPVGEPLAHDGRVRAVAGVVADGRPLAVTGGTGGLVRVWDLATGEDLHGPLAGHGSAVTAVTTVVVDGRPLAVTADGDTVRLWEPATGAPVGEPIGLPAVTDAPRREREREPADEDAEDAGDIDDIDEDEDEEPDDGPVVKAVAAAVVDGRPVLAVGVDDGLAHVWDLLTRTPVGPPLRATDDGLTAMTVARIAGRPVLVTGGSDGTVRTWDLATLARVGPDLVLPLPVGALAAAPADRLVAGFGWEVAVFRLAEHAGQAGGGRAEA
ncbi:hypothetical protein ACIQOW_28550 [Kitasatospora sp. NPDC091335]|uniref:hypothetical protein n=1 Tax=Kitasatospora sp. NPDC091335 TaxID=3364085 RepID=UPI00380664B5